MKKTIQKNIHSTLAAFLALFLLVTPALQAQYEGTGIFEQITTLEELESGSYYVFYGINGTYNGAMTNSFASSGRLDNTSVTITASGIVDPSEEIVWLVEGNSEDGYTVYNEEADVYAEITANNTSGFRLNNPATHAFVVTVNGGNFEFSSDHSSANNRVMAIYQNDWRTYASGNTLHLYKLSEVEDPLLIVAPLELTGLSYNEDEGPSDSQSISVGGINLDPAAGDITVDADGTDFEVSTDDENFHASVTLSYTDGELSEQDVYVRLVSGLEIDSYSDKIEISGGGADPVEVDVSGDVSIDYEYTETFENYPETGTAYDDGDFEGVLGNTWFYVNARGTPTIDAPTPVLRNTTDATLNTELTGGISEFSFDYMQAFSTSVNLEVHINDELVATVTSDGEQNIVKNSGIIAVQNVTGTFTIEFKQGTGPTGGQVAIDNFSWNPSEEDPPDLDPPVFSLSAGNYFENQTVFVSNYEDYSESAEVRYTLDGEDPDETSTLYDDGTGIEVMDGAGPVTLKAIAIDGEETTTITSVVYTFPLNVADLDELWEEAELGSAANGPFYRITGEVVVTFNESDLPTNNRNQRYVQDGTAGLKIDDNPGNLTTELDVGDGVQNLIGHLSAFNRMLQFNPTAGQSPSEKSSSDNKVIPQTITLADAIDPANFRTVAGNDYSKYQGQLIRIAGVTFEGEGDDGNFSTSVDFGTIEVSDPSITLGDIQAADNGFLFRVEYGALEYNNEPIPEDAQNLTLLFDQRNETIRAFARDYDDFADYETSREIAGAAGWRMLSIPVSGLTIEALAGQNQVQGITGIADFYGESAPAGIEEAVPNLYTGYENDAWTAPDNVTDQLIPGKGLIWYMYDNDEGVSTSLPFSLTLGGLEPFGSTTLSLSEPGNGFNLIGNPFRTDIDINDIDQWANGGVIGSKIVQVWENDENGWQSGVGHQGKWMMVGEGQTHDKIAAWQGFFVENNDADEIRIPVEAKTDGADFFKEKPSSIKMLAFTLDGVNTSSQTIKTKDNVNLVFSDNASEGWDLLDATKLPPIASVYAILSIIGPGNGDMVAKAQESRPIDFEGQFELPIAFEANNMSGEFTISWDGISNMRPEWNFTLIDHELDNSIDLRQEESYVFEYQPLEKIRPDDRDVDEKEGVHNVLDISETRFTLAIGSEPVSGEKSTDLPKELVLFQNYPNPFNPSTLIRYEMPKEAHVNLRIYDMLGKEIAVLVDGKQSPGSHEILWDASNLSSGIYLFRLEAGGQVLTQRMTLIK